MTYVPYCPSAVGLFSYIRKALHMNAPRGKLLFYLENLNIL